jgi:hypothetical protein
MSKFLTLAIGVFALAGVMPATPIACPSGGSLAVLIALPTTGPDAGCQSQDKIFSNFAYDPLGGSVSASNITAGLVFQQPGGNTDIHGWNFIPTVGSWATGFTLSFTISIAPGNPNVSIFASKDQIDSGLLPNGVVMTDVQTGVGTLTTTGVAGSETLQVSYPGLQSITTSSAATIPTGSGLLSFEQEWFESTANATPEPITMLLAGAGLLCLGFLQRRPRKA